MNQQAWTPALGGHTFQWQGDGQRTSKRSAMLYIRRWLVLWREAKWRVARNWNIKAEWDENRGSQTLGERGLQAEAWPVQRPWGRIMAHVIKELQGTSDRSTLVTARGEMASVEGNQRAGSSRALSAWQRFHLTWGGQKSCFVLRVDSRRWWQRQGDWAGAKLITR